MIKPSALQANEIDTIKTLPSKNDPSSLCSSIGSDFREPLSSKSLSE